MPNGAVDVATGAPNPQTYRDNGDGTVSDTVTGLMWQKAVGDGAFYTWSGAITYCPTLVLGGHTDWRLPTRIELLSLVDYSVGDDDTNASIDAVAFPNTPLKNFWSASPDFDYAWVVNFTRGSVTELPKTGAEAVRCVR